MELSLSEISKLETVIKKNNIKIINLTDNFLLLKKADSALKKAFKENIFDHGLLKIILQMGTVLRRSQGDLLKVSFTFFESFIDIISESKDDNKAHTILSIRYITFKLLKEALNFDQFQKLGSRMVWPDEDAIIKQSLEKLSPVSINQINSFFTTFKDVFSEMTFSETVPSDYRMNIKKLFQISKDESDVGIKARKVFAYLVKHDDVVPDDYGFFGLVDDIQVVDDILLEIYPEKTSQKILNELLVNNSSTLSLSFERNSNELDISTLIGLSKPINFILSSIMYLLETGTRRILGVLPEQGPMALNLLITLMLKVGEIKKSINIENIEVGDQIYFNRPRASVAVSYLGPIEDYPDNFLIGDKNNTKVMLPNFAAQFATKEPQHNNVVEDASQVNDWKLDKISFAPPHLNISSIGKKIYYLTKYNVFKEQISISRPFGVSINKLINFKYETYNGKIIHHGPKSLNLPVVEVFSRPDSLLEKVYEDDTNKLIICDNNETAKNFLETLTGINDHLEIIILCGTEHKSLQEIANKVNFSTVYFPSQIAEFPEPKYKLEYDDPISRLEKKYFKSTKPQDKNFQTINSEIFNNFSTSLNKLYANFLDKQHLDKHLLWKLSSIGKIIFNQWYERNQIDKDKTLTRLDEIIRDCSINQDYDENLKNIFNILNTNRDNLSDFIDQRSVISFLRINIENNYGVIVETSTEKLRANSFFEKKGIFNCEPISFADLKGQFFNKTLLVPYLFSTINNKYLINNNISDKIEFFMFQNEIRDFESQGVATKKAIYKLENETVKSFSKTRVYNIIKNKKIKEPPVIIKDEIPTSEYENEYLLSRVKNDNKGSSDSVDALAFYLNNNESYILLAPRAKVISFETTMVEGRYVNSFFEKTASELSLGDKICIAQDSKSDLFDQLAMLTEKEYPNIKLNSSLWKTEIKILLSQACSGSLTELQKLLESENIKRNVVTLKTWFSDSTMIAPLNYEEVLNNLTKLPVQESYKKSVGEILKNIDSAYKIRRDASDKVLDLLNRNQSFDRNDSEIDLKFGSANLGLSVFEISFQSDSLNVQIDNLWKINRF